MLGTWLLALVQVCEHVAHSNKPLTLETTIEDLAEYIVGELEADTSDAYIESLITRLMTAVGI